jgi:hypothetical protein
VFVNIGKELRGIVDKLPETPPLWVSTFGKLSTLINCPKNILLKY